MRHIAMLVVAASAAACTIPEKQLVAEQGEGEPFACLNQPLPSKAPAQVKIAGTVLDPFAGDIPAGAPIEVFLVGNSGPVFSETIAADGTFTHDQGTGLVPHDFYAKTAPNGFLPSLYYPATPLANDVNATIFVFKPADLGPIGALANVTIDTATKSMFTVLVTDCNGKPLGGATVSSEPAGDVRYFINSAPNPSAISTDAMFGMALIANVPAVNVTIKAEYMGMTLRSHTMDAQPGFHVMTGIQP